MTVREQILRIARERYGNELPYGVARKIADELGVSRQYVSNVLRTSPSTRSCSLDGCSADRGQRSRWCDEHTEVVLRCDACGATVVRDRHVHNTRMSTPRYRGRVFCDRRCFGRFAGRNFGFGKDRV